MQCIHTKKKVYFYINGINDLNYNYTQFAYIMLYTGFYFKNVSVFKLFCLLEFSVIIQPFLQSMENNIFYLAIFIPICIRTFAIFIFIFILELHLKTLILVRNTDLITILKKKEKNLQNSALMKRKGKKEIFNILD